MGAAALAGAGVTVLVVTDSGSQAACIIGGCVILFACIGWGTVRGTRAALDALAADADSSA
ncbi:hypothetical protein GCM10025867_06330 [Frondihabitans sucicola]|uniref:Uncharacterized protein n=1 Tax=Frondihabitans sucicola TaxID=1268041 RepID=A0ABM8GJP7_9MICO|nr:hypothetical protein GCM10025867_06330 [Frondihabitans sucicola]